MRSDLYWDCILSAVQMLLFGAAAFLLVHYGLRCRQRSCRKTIFLHAGGILCIALGDLFVVLFLILRQSWPGGFNASEISWLGCFFFFAAAQQALHVKKKKQWYVLVLSALPIAVHIITTVLYGNWISDLLWACAMTYMTWNYASGVCAAAFRRYHIVMLVFVIIDLSMFLSWGMVYVVLDFLMLLSLLISCAVLYREVENS